MTSRTQEDTTTTNDANDDLPVIERHEDVIGPPRPIPTPLSQPQSPVQLRQPLISNVLRAALFSAKDRSFIIGLEQDLLAFITSHTDSYLLRPMNSYYRLLTHQTAEYYGLGHTLNKEGNSIVVFKNFGGDPTPPVPLVSLPFDPQLAMTPQQPPQQQYVFQQGAPPGSAPGVAPGSASGPVPMGYGFAPQYGGYPQGVPYGQQQPFNNKYGNNRYQPHQPRHFNNKHHHQRQNNQSSAGTDHTESSDKPTTSTIKLMKRSEEDEPVVIAQPSVDEPPVEPKKDAETLANERATRETEYQRARERIFQGEDEIDEDLIDDLNQMSIRSPNLPRSLPSQPQHPYGGGYVATNMPMTNGPPQQYYYNQGYPQMMMYDPYQQPVYYNQMNYNTGYRKKNYNNGYRSNRNYNYRNGDNKEKEQEENAPKEDVNGEEV